MPAASASRTPTTPACCSSTARRGPTATPTSSVPWWAVVLGQLRRAAHCRVRRRQLPEPAASATTTSPVARHDDLIFGQLGNDVIQGDGGDRVRRRRQRPPHVGASRTPRRLRRARVCDLVGAARPSCAELRGGHGRPGLHRGRRRQRHHVRRPRPGRHPRRQLRLLQPDHADHRPDGADILFGGAGYQRPSNGQRRRPRRADTARPRRRHDRRRQRPDHPDRRHQPHRRRARPTKYVSFVYDNGYGEQIVVRGVTLLDYTPGGPDFRPDLFHTNSRTRGGPRRRPGRRATRCTVRRRRHHLHRRGQRHRLRRRRRRRHHRRLGQRLDLRRHRPGRRPRRRRPHLHQPQHRDRRHGSRRSLHRERGRHLLQRAALRHPRLLADRPGHAASATATSSTSTSPRRARCRRR